MIGMINMVAVLACTCISLILGLLWYTPMLFGKPWMKAVGLKKNDIKPKDMIKGYLINLAAAFIQTLVLAILIVNTGTEGITQGLYIGMAVGAGIVATTIFTNDSFEGRPLSLSLINGGYRLIYFVIIGGILGTWQ
jgi:hypothetical protein